MSAQVEFYWRSGCPFCARLRGDLQRVGLPVREINIWEDPAAAATVRSVANGNETVPTVVVGDKAMVNPTATQVLDAVRVQAPELLDQIDENAATRLAQGTWWSAALASVVVAIVWFLLATANPTTTYHVAPLLVAAAWPILRRWRTGSALAARTALACTAGGTAIALVTAALLAARNALAGPTLVGSGSAQVETVIVIVLGAVIGGVVAVVGHPRATVRR